MLLRNSQDMASSTPGSPRHPVSQGGPLQRALAPSLPPQPGEPLPLAVESGARRSWIEALFLWPAMLLVLWACYAEGAFLTPARTVVALVAPALGLTWMISYRIRTVRGVPTYPRFGATEWLFLGLAGFAALSASWSLEWPRTLQEAGVLLGGFVFMRLGREVGSWSSAARSSVLLVVSEMGVLLALASIAGYLLGLPRFTQTLEGMVLPTGTFGYANALAGFLLLSLASTITLYVESSTHHTEEAFSKYSMRRLLLAGTVVLQLAALALTRSRAAGAAVAVVLLVFFAMRAFGAAKGSYSRRWVGIALVLVLVAGLFAGGVLVWRELQPQMPMSADVFRVNTWKAGLQAAYERPLLGYGLGTFYEAYSPFKTGAHTTYAHNILVQQLVELGGLGLVMLMAFLSMAIIRPMKAFFGPGFNPQIPLLLGLQAFVLQNLVDLTWYFPALLLVFMLLLGLMSSYSRPQAHEHVTYRTDALLGYRSQA